MENALYGADAPHAMLGHGSDLEDPARPGQFNATAIGAYRCNPAASLLRAWDNSIPAADKQTWRDPAVAEAYVAEALASDPQSMSHTPPCFRSPTGALEDSFYLATGRQLWDASFIYVPTLVITSERDFWSRLEDRRSLIADLVHAPLVRSAVIPNATHFVHLDRAEHGRADFINEVLAFLSTAPGAGFAKGPRLLPEVRSVGRGRRKIARIDSQTDIAIAGRRAAWAHL